MKSMKSCLVLLLTLSLNTACDLNTMTTRGLYEDDPQVMSLILKAKAPMAAKMIRKTVCAQAKKAKTHEEIEIMLAMVQDLRQMTYENGYYDWIGMKDYVKANVPADYQVNVFLMLDFAKRETRWARQTKDLPTIQFYVNALFTGVEEGLQCAKEKLSTPEVPLEEGMVSYSLLTSDPILWISN
jgi:hypothetical protein